MLGWLKRIRAFAKPTSGGLRTAVRFVRGRYDAAQTPGLTRSTVASSPRRASRQTVHRCNDSPKARRTSGGPSLVGV
jgi:hypothetical protein